MLVANPCNDSAAIILYNHYTFVLDLAYRANVDLAPIAPPSFVEGKAETIIKKKVSPKPKANLELGVAKEETCFHLPCRLHRLSYTAIGACCHCYCLPNHYSVRARFRQKRANISYENVY
jgi:hypothetical protein